MTIAGRYPITGSWDVLRGRANTRFAPTDVFHSVIDDFAGLTLNEKFNRHCVEGILWLFATIAGGRMNGKYDRDPHRLQATNCICIWTDVLVGANLVFALFGFAL